MAVNQTYGGPSVMADALDTGASAARRGGSIGAKLGGLGGFLSSWAGILAGGGIGTVVGIAGAVGLGMATGGIGIALALGIIFGTGLIGAGLVGTVTAVIGAVGGWLAGGTIGGIAGFGIGAVESKSNQKRMALEAKHMEQQYRIAMEQGRRAGQMATLQRMEAQQMMQAQSAVVQPATVQSGIEAQTPVAVVSKEIEEQRLENELVGNTSPNRPTVVQRVLAEGKGASPVKDIIEQGPSASAVERVLENAQQSGEMSR